VLLLAGLTGAATGLIVAGFDRLTADVLFEAVLGLPFWAQALAPAVGLLVAAGCLRLAGRGTTPSTSDEYIRDFHDAHHRLELRVVPARLLASVATLGSGAPLGYEGPALYAGAAVGSGVQRRLQRWFTAEESKVLLVAGAAAGVAAIFKAPVTGLVFALEVPYKEDLARRMLLPAAISSAASYVVFAAIAGTAPLLPVAGQPPFNLVDLGGAAMVGLVCGLLARLFIALIHRAKRLSTLGHPVLRAAAAGAVLAGTVFAARLLGDEPLALGPGYNALRWALEPQHSVLAIIVLGTLRVVGTGAAIGGGGAGGMFIPLVIQGALVGRAVGGIFGSDTTSLFPVVGMAAFLGAGYRVPLAAVVFVAEFTGRPGFVVPGLIAAVVAQLVLGRTSLSPYQAASPIGHLETRLRLPISSFLDTDAPTVSPETLIEDLVWQHHLGTGHQSVAVTQDGIYLGTVHAEDLRGIERHSWDATPARAVMRTDLPTADQGWLLADAVRAMKEAGTDRLPVCKDGLYIGVITTAHLVQLDQLLDQDDPGTDPQC